MRTESPIEYILWNELQTRLGFSPTDSADPGPGLWIYTQYEIDQFRVDIRLLFVGDKSASELVVECDGKAYHSSPDQRARDQLRQAIIEDRGYKILRFTGSDINSRPDEVLLKIAEALGIWGPAVDELIVKIERERLRSSHIKECRERDLAASYTYDEWWVDSDRLPPG